MGAIAPPSGGYSPCLNIYQINVCVCVCVCVCVSVYVCEWYP